MKTTFAVIVMLVVVLFLFVVMIWFDICTSIATINWNLDRIHEANQCACVSPFDAPRPWYVRYRDWRVGRTTI